MFIKNIAAAIGNTPLLAAKRFAPDLDLFVKCEACNPGGSIKDRVALSIINDAEEKGLLKPGDLIIEATSGNMGIALALIAAQRSYRLILSMPESMSMERRKILKAMGAELLLIPAELGMQGAVEQVKGLASQHENCFIPNQFSNPANTKAHYEGTAIELWEELSGKIDVLLCGVGSGGTISGCGSRLKEMNPNIFVVAVEPTESPLLTKGQAGSHGIQGIGANFVPPILKQDLIDRVLLVSTEEAIQSARHFTMREGLSVGISSGAVLHGARLLGKSKEFQKKRMVAILPDGGERYLSTELFD